MQREGVFKRLLDRCKRVRLCPRCGKGVRQRLGSVQCGCMVLLLALFGFAALSAWLRECLILHWLRGTHSCLKKLAATHQS